MNQSLFIGIEGGATRTTGVVVDEGLEILAQRSAGPTNLHAVAEPAAREAMREILASLCRSVGTRWERVGATAFCLAGIRTDADRADWRRIASDLAPPWPLVLGHDADASLAAGSADRTGVLVVSGTGSLVFGRRADGAERFVGGRGPILGDDGSGFDIARRGLRAAVRAADGRAEPTRLRQLLPERLGLGGLEDLAAWVRPYAKDRVAGAAPIVFQAAEAGDRVAERILQSAAAELAGGAAALVEALWPGGDWPRRVVLAGGVLRSQQGFRSRLAAELTRRLGRVECVLPDCPGAVGAARIARDALPR